MSSLVIINKSMLALSKSEVKKKNPWTIKQRQILAEIVNDATGFTLPAHLIIGVVIDSYKNQATIYWEGGCYCFDRHLLKELVKEKLAISRVRQRSAIANLPVIAECRKRGLIAKKSITKDAFIVSTNSGGFVGIISYGQNGWYVTRSSGNGCPIFVNNLADAVLSLWMLEVAVIAA